MPTEEFLALPLEQRVTIRLNFLKLWLQQIELIDYYRKLGEQEGNVLIEGLAKDLLHKFSIAEGPSHEEIQEFWMYVNKSCIDAGKVLMQDGTIQEDPGKLVQ
jgi:hypothetical protein